jgi:hypothetical protein
LVQPPAEGPQVEECERPERDRISAAWELGVEPGMR